MRLNRLAVRAVGTAAGSALLVVGLAAKPAAAQSFVPCAPTALANAITTANVAGGMLVLAPGCVYSLPTALPHIENRITIEGGGATITRALAAPSFRIFTVDNTGDLSLHRAIISNGQVSGDFGGAIRNDGMLTVTRSVIRDNQADYGGGIGGNTGSTARISRSYISGNTALQEGGGLANEGTMTVNESFITGNDAVEKGGGVTNDGTLKVSRTAIESNTASGPSGVGGGIVNSVAGGLAKLSESIVINNTATDAPGGIYDDTATILLHRTTVVANQPTNCAGSPTPVLHCVN
ncbi:hypothetical protein LN042_33695 [Kitasatospora sp. RB6PN24]|uniref:hypothetical protein n=1 Tax=Kitasatospora humi TaxID=2893891 RepID=UPI001E3FCC40|nr:hypothetical protein [Kitasatospora humi]MCC9311959.1 hypothetical protein [Kitasatospora humi]